MDDNYAKFYNPLENLALDKVIVKYRGRVIFRQYIPKKRKCFGIKIYKLCDEAGYMCAMRVYLGKDSQSTTDDRTATHATVRHFSRRVEGLGHKINSCGTVRPNRKDMSHDFRPKQLKLKRGDIRVKTRGDLTALVWKDRRDVYMLTNMDPPPAEGNFCDDSSRPVKPHIVEKYNWHMGFVDISDRMANRRVSIRIVMRMGLD